MEIPKILENIFFSITCISIFTCIIRSDYNFAMGLLGYYMIKGAAPKESLGRTVKVVSYLYSPILTAHVTV